MSNFIFILLGAFIFLGGYFYGKSQVPIYQITERVIVPGTKIETVKYPKKLIMRMSPMTAGIIVMDDEGHTYVSIGTKKGNWKVIPTEDKHA